jgi:hypothetical protein
MEGRIFASPLSLVDGAQSLDTLNWIRIQLIKLHPIMALAPKFRGQKLASLPTNVHTLELCQDFPLECNCFDLTLLRSRLRLPLLIKNVQDSLRISVSSGKEKVPGTG